MELRYSVYTPVRKGYTVEKMLSLLPQEVRAASMRPNSLILNEEQSEIVEAADRALGIHKLDMFAKQRHVEVDEDGIGPYKFFEVGLSVCFVGVDMQAITIGSDCDVEHCPAGKRLAAPYKVKSKRIGELDLAEIVCADIREKMLLVSEELVQVFERENVTGLVYHDVVSHNVKSRAQRAAKVSIASREIADAVAVNEWICNKHSVPLYFNDLNKNGFSTVQLEDVDFQLMDRIDTSSRTYLLPNPLVIVSRRILQIILKFRPRRLVDIGLFLDVPFKPIL